MFVSCWVTVLMIQNSHDASSVPRDGLSVMDNKLPFMPVKNKQDHNQPRHNIAMNATVKETRTKNSVGNNTPHFPRKTLLSTREHLAANKTRANSTNKMRYNHVSIDSIPSLNEPSSLQMLSDKFLTLNKEERIYNAEKFAPLVSDDIILIVQVHKRVEYLRQLLDSLRAARDIEEVLLVVSSDYYLEEMNQLVQSVEFCKVGCCHMSLSA